MRLEGKALRLSPSDLVNHIGCAHATELNYLKAHGKLEPPSWQNAMLDLLIERGHQHEADFAEGKRAVESTVYPATIARDTWLRLDQTLDAMRAGYDYIAQARLESGRWTGFADFLMKVPGPSKFGDYHYQVIDAKLSRETKAGTMLQLSLYTDILAGLQERMPEHFHVATPVEFETYRTADFAAYYRFARRETEAAVCNPVIEPRHYPEPVPRCDVCQWWKRCDTRRRDDDHLSFVAGISSSQRKELVSRGIDSLTVLGQTTIDWNPKRGSKPSLERVANQARVQLAGRVLDKPHYELLDSESGEGLGRLPKPDKGDIFFDFEGDAFVGIDGLEYLFGYCYFDDAGELQYDCLWALRPADEKRAFVQFMQFLIERRTQYPGFHIYHFAPYEPSALKRLMGKHAVCADDLDWFLRAERFVDLHRVVKQAMLASVEKYSIKDLEPFFGFERELDLREASAALRAVEHPLELGMSTEIDPAALAKVEKYNRDDCASTWRLRNWLEGLREKQKKAGYDLPRPELKAGEASDVVYEAMDKIAVLQQQLWQGLPEPIEDLAELDDTQRACWVLGHLLEYFRREDKVSWWEFFRLAELPDDELEDEKAAIWGLQFAENRPISERARVPVHRYRFPAQQCHLKRGSALHYTSRTTASNSQKLGSVENIDLDTSWIDIKKTAATVEVHPDAVFAHDHVRADTIVASLMRFADHCVNEGINNDRPLFKARRRLLMRCLPRFEGSDLEPTAASQPVLLDRACYLVNRLDHSTLPIQGPPGSGKTYTGARMICELVRQEKTVALTAVSHKVIRNLLDKTVKAAAEQGLSIRIAQGNKRLETDEFITVHSDTKALEGHILDGSYDLIGGTAWLWCRKELEESVDYLFVDEAGQMSLAMVLAAAQCAKNIVLLGDPIQLEQPQQATHPEGTACSALEYILDGADTMPPNRGLFLDKTWRLHPALCKFTSEVFYEGRLESVDGLSNQCLSGCGDYNRPGLHFVAVSHEGNGSESVEEVEIVKNLVSELLQGSWTDMRGDTNAMTQKDILIVSPFNAQVGRLKAALPGSKIGTVDKFQGQQAPVVIYSMASSSPDDAPRGLGFLFDRSRLNVATSRPRAVCILVGNPALFEAECRSVSQMRLVNGGMRYLEGCGVPEK